MRGCFVAAARAWRQNRFHSLSGTRSVPTRNTLSRCASPAPPIALSARASTSPGSSSRRRFTSAGRVSCSSRRSSSSIGRSERFAAA